jgi:hypothetical protein
LTGLDHQAEPQFGVRFFLSCPVQPGYESIWTPPSLDLTRRTLLQVHLEDAFKADEMFR